MKNYIAAWALLVMGNMYVIDKQPIYAIAFLIMAIINFVLSYISWSLKNS